MYVYTHTCVCIGMCAYCVCVHDMYECVCMYACVCLCMHVRTGMCVRTCHGLIASVSDSAQELNSSVLIHVYSAYFWSRCVHFGSFSSAYIAVHADGNVKA
jgi:hypothetical protein